MRFLFAVLACIIAFVPSFVLAEYNKNAFTAPLGGDIVTVGRSFQIRWINPDGGIINLILVRGDPNNLRTVNTLAMGFPNDGYFNWYVPWDLAPGNDYALEIQSGAEKNYTPRFTVIGNPSYPVANFVPSAQYSGAPTSMMEKATSASSNDITESYPIDPTTATTTTATETYIVASDTLIFPTPTTTQEPITIDASSAVDYSVLIFTYPTSLTTLINGTSITYSANGTTTTTSAITATTGESVGSKFGYSRVVSILTIILAVFVA